MNNQLLTATPEQIEAFMQLTECVDYLKTLSVPDREHLKAKCFDAINEHCANLQHIVSSVFQIAEQGA